MRPISSLPISEPRSLWASSKAGKVVLPSPPNWTRGYVGQLSVAGDPLHAAATCGPSIRDRQQIVSDQTVHFAQLGLDGPAHFGGCFAVAGFLQQSDGCFKSGASGHHDRRTAPTRREASSLARTINSSDFAATRAGLPSRAVRPARPSPRSCCQHHANGNEREQERAAGERLTAFKAATPCPTERGCDLRLAVFRHVHFAVKRPGDLVPDDDAIMSGRNVVPRKISVRAGFPYHGLAVTTIAAYMFAWMWQYTCTIPSRLNFTDGSDLSG